DLVADRRGVGRPLRHLNFQPEHDLLVPVDGHDPAPESELDLLLLPEDDLSRLLVLSLFLVEEHAAGGLRPPGALPPDGVGVVWTLARIENRGTLDEGTHDASICRFPRDQSAPTRRPGNRGRSCFRRWCGLRGA